MNVTIGANHCLTFVIIRVIRVSNISYVIYIYFLVRGHMECPCIGMIIFAHGHFTNFVTVVPDLIK